MKAINRIAAALGVVVPLALASHPAAAEDQLKVAIGQINNWENQAPTLGQDAGIFKKHGLVLENVGTQGAGETLQAVISGSADIGIELNGNYVKSDVHGVQIGLAQVIK